jgi:branched-chain amino acid aminotransferase
MDRLYESARVVDMDIPLTREQMIGALDQTAAANQMTQDVHARLMITRGLKSKPFQDPRLSQQGPTIAIIMEHSKVPEDIYHKGITLHTVPIYRGLPVTQDPKLNSHSKLNCILACIHAQKAGADEALMLDPHGFVNTTNSCNFFIVRKGEVWTSTGDYCMNGITRQKVIDLCQGSPDSHSCSQLLPDGNLWSRRGLPNRNLWCTNARGVQSMAVRLALPGQWPVIEKLRQLYKDLVRTDTA